MTASSGPAPLATAIAADGITLRYGARAALDEFTVEIPRGGVFGLLGPNGSGKSTFITLVAAAEPPPAGTLRILGEPPATPVRARIGTVFQENTADPLMTPLEYLQLAGRLFGLGGHETRRRAQQLLERFALGDRGRTPIATLSGGMRRRLEIARALLHDPDLLLLDEPTTGVDAEERRAFWQGLQEEAGHHRTVVLATNDLVEADAVCERVAFVRAGSVVAAGVPGELKRDLRSETVRVTCAGPPGQLATRIAAWPGVGQVIQTDDEIRVTVDDAAAFVPRLFELAPGAIRAVEIHRSTLEDAYFQYVAGPAGAGQEARTT